MSNAIVKISRRAKQIQRSTGKAWNLCIKQASAEYRSGKIGAAKKPWRQTGTSVKRIDRQRKAKPPGKRKSKTGKTYYERRKNRSDVPGSITGLKAAVRSRLKEKLSKQLLQREMATTKTKRRKASKAISETKGQLKKFL